MNKNVDLIMINQQEEEQLRAQGRMILLAFPFIPNVLILGIQGKASGFPRCTSFNAQVQ